MGTEGAEKIADTSPGCLNGSLVGLAQQGLQLGEHHLDRIEVGAAGGKKEQLGPDGTDRVARGLPLWLPRLSAITMAPGLRVGTRNWTTQAVRSTP